MSTRSHRKRKRRRDIVRHTAPNAPAGTIAVDPAAPKSHVRLFAFGHDTYEEFDHVPIEKIKQELAKHTVIWVNVEGLGDKAVIEQMGELFGLHRLALEDVVHVHQRAKVEQFGDTLFYVAPMVASTEPFASEQLSIFISPRFVLTFQEGHPGDSFEGVRQRLRTDCGRIRKSGPDYLAYTLIDALIDGYYPALERHGDRLDELEDMMSDINVNRGTIDELHVIKGELRQIRRAIWPQREAVGALLRDSTTQISAETKVFLRDCYDHVVQLIDLVETYREMAADLRDLYNSSISNRINETMRVLTIISTIFIPITFIASIYGMNFDTKFPGNMPELVTPYGYVMVLAWMIGTAIAMLIYFYRQGWIFRGGSYSANPPERK